ncbi:MAG: hypothetical protein U9R16_00735 [Campylobacterota bacterium]|nr:hypothetical protein [Campylobacterota bacterium]
MFKFLLLILMSITSLYANFDNKYNVYKSGISLGVSNNFNTLNKGYIVLIPTNKILKIFISFDKYIIYEEGKKPNIKGDNKYKRDKHMLLNLIRELSSKQPQSQTLEDEKYILSIECKDGRCDYKKTYKKKEKTSTGYLDFNNNSLYELYDKESGISFKRIDSEK